MDAIDLLQYQVRDTYEWLEMTLADVWEEEADWQPPGTANSIGSAYAHLVLSADADINCRPYGASPLAAEYGGRIGLSKVPPFGADWEEWASRVSVEWGELRRYGRAVHQGSEERLQSTTMTELCTGTEARRFEACQFVVSPRNRA